ncbi:galactan beta-1,4-galactosyltransferase GALS3-like [Amaranthus tricolor]|uniref:galactan beta-1,4-galactosyltransferase GALS3-like n=1 Tax=Amaranthus tricolor TaxID=29722 RepID=UPI002582ED77|nr:galactan beta-1,4-galactosyltransferase GALS3-like [Amaranthus tricolor]
MGKNFRQISKKQAAKMSGLTLRRWNCATELKFIFIILFIFCSLVTFFQFFPLQFFPFSSNLTSCSTPTIASIYPSPPRQPSDQILEDGVIRRSFYPVGVAAYNFVLMSAYRGGLSSFAIMGLSSKPLHNFGHPTYTCEYQFHDPNRTSLIVQGNKLEFQDFGYARVYLVIVINCTFPDEVMDPSIGGRLVLHASTNGGYDQAVNSTDTIIALNEPPNSWEISHFLSPPRYDYLYCGGSLFGDLSPQRVREWIAYHVRLFGKKSHFVIHDAGGVHPEVMEVLKPWMELGYVTVEDIREEGRFDAFYHNQMLVLNDCLHRHRSDTKWMFFFDVDEYIYLPTNMDFHSVMDSLKDYTMFIIEQVSMSNQLCLADDSGQFFQQWGFEKLVYRNAKKMRRDHKYAIQPRNVYATGVHMSENYVGKSTQLPDKTMKYFHFHGTVAERHEPCRRKLKDPSITMEKTPYALDTSLRSLAPLVKQFELDTIGSRLQSTRL